MGRYLSKDPIGLSAGDVNLYRYVWNDSVNWSDPEGLLVKRILKEIAKRKMRNSHLAGKIHPNTKVHFKATGYPDFSKWSIKTVQIKQTGNRCKDEAAANLAARLSETPPGYTWHHVEDGTTMQLVESVIHSKTGHSGGVEFLKGMGQIVLGGLITTLEVMDALDPFTYITSGEREPPPGFVEGPFGTWTKVD